MTIVFNITHGIDAFSENDALTLFKDERSGSSDVSVLRCSAKSLNKEEAHYQSLVNVTQATAKAMNNSSNLWLLLATGNIPSQNTINKHYKLHRLYLKQGYKMPNASPLDEVYVQTQKSSRWFSAIPVDQQEIGLVTSILERSYPAGTNHLVCLPDSCTEVVRNIINKGWEISRAPSRPSCDLIDTITNANGCLFYLIGFFDDPDIGATVFGSSPLITKVRNALTLLC